MSEEWAVRIRWDAYCGAENTEVAAFKVDRVTAKSLIGDALYLRQHPISECVRGLSEAEAKNMERSMKYVIYSGKDIIRRERDTIRSMINDTLKEAQ